MTYGVPFWSDRFKNIRSIVKKSLYVCDRYNKVEGSEKPPKVAQAQFQGCKYNWIRSVDFSSASFSGDFSYCS